MPRHPRRAGSSLTSCSVFRWHRGVSSDAVAEKLEDIGLHVVSIEPDRAVVAFRDDQNLSAFRDAMKVYEAGPKGTNLRTRQPYKSTPYDIFEYVEADQMKLWSPQDRIGPRLAQKIGSDGSGIDENATYVVELDLWHRGTDQLAEAGRKEIEQAVSATKRNDVDRVVDWFVGEYMCLVKAHVRGLTLKKLLDMPIVAEIDLPPTPVFDAVQTGRADKKSFAQPPKPNLDGPRVCVVDSGIAAAHPLLASNVGHEEAILTTAISPADQHGHGTRVGAIAVFGSIRACYESGAFSSPVVLFSARVLNERNQFDDERLIVKQMQPRSGCSRGHRMPAASSTSRSERSCRPTPASSRRGPKRSTSLHARSRC
jgi:subtilase family protein